VGLLGGSFNPAHSGHLHISKQALNRLGLDQVWWLVSPQNPLKSKLGMASYNNRMSHANSIKYDPRIRVCDLENKIGTCYTSETLEKLKLQYPNTRFIWLMGADLLPEMSNWKNWSNIFNLVPIAIFDRWPYANQLSVSKTAKKFDRYRRPDREAELLVDMHPPSWVYIFCPLNAMSSTFIRYSGKNIKAKKYISN
jgi:nicotinate-nucleotide adenylyltransferase